MSDTGWTVDPSRKDRTPDGFNPVAHRMAGGLTLYDVSTDTTRPATQEDLTDMQDALSRLCKQRDKATKDEEIAYEGMKMWKETAERLARINLELRERIDFDQVRALTDEVTALRKRLWLPVEPGNHDYVGPTKPDPDTGRPVPVDDPVHERFHGAIGDVIAGRVIPAARRQMQEALKKVPKEPVPIPTARDTDDPRRMGSEWLARL